MSHFVSIEACPICQGRESTTSFYEAAFDQSPVFDFITAYYDGRVPREVLAGETFQIRHCSACDFYWHVRVLNEASATRFYDEWIDPDASRAKQLSRGVVDRMHQCSLIVRWLAAANALRTDRPRVIDVGGGWGTLATCAQALGCETFLLESSRARRDYAERLGIRTVGFFSELQLGTFQLAIMSQSLEHIPQPLRLLQQVRDLLAPGGGLTVSVPRAQPRHPVLKKGPFQPLEHVNGFSSQALTEALTRAGFQLVSDYSRYAEVSLAGALGVIKRNLGLRLGWSGSSTAEGLSVFAVRPRRG